MRVAIYPRVSTQEQAKEGYSIGEQIERLNKYCEAMGWDVHKIYTDAGYSGATLDRPGIQELIKDVEAKKVDKVVVYKLDRLSRSQKQTLYLIEDVFLENGVDFVSMSENFDTSTPFGRAMIGILAVFAQLEREQIKERMGMGKEARAKLGKWHGGSTPPIGYDYIEIDDKLVVNEYEIMQVRELFDLFLKGVPLRTIETLYANKGYRHKHGLWTPKAMRRVLSNKCYIGYLKYKDEYYPAEQEPTIDVDVFERAGKLLQDRKEQYKISGVKPGVQTTYLGGLINCKHCEGKYTKQAGKRRKDGTTLIYYTCYSRSKKVKAMIKDPNCKNKNYKMHELDDTILNEIKKLSLDPNYIQEIKNSKNDQSDTPNKVAIIKKEIESIDDQISLYMDLYALKKLSIDAIGKKIDPLSDTKAKLEKELETLNASTDSELSEEEVIEIVKTFDDVISRGNFEEIRLLIESLIYYLEIDNDKVTIHWKFA